MIVDELAFWTTPTLRRAYAALTPGGGARLAPQTEGDLNHDGDPVLARHVGHAVAKETPYGTIIGKEHPASPHKIDAAVAAVVAFERAAWHASRPIESLVYAL